MIHLLLTLLISNLQKYSLANIVSSSSFPNNSNKNIENEYFKKPILKWTTSLCSGKIYECGLNAGNGILSSLDNRYLYVTTDDGTLSIIKSKTGKVVKKYVSERDDDSYYTICQSSVSIFYKRKGNVDDGNDINNWEVDYLVYSVIDISVKDENSEDESRIIALDSKGNKLWSSTIKGVTNGTPLIGINGKYIYISHNKNNETYGHISVLDARDNGKVVFISSSDDILPYGPLSIQSKSEIDTLYWAESIGKGYSNKKDDLSKVHKMTVNRNKFDVQVIHKLQSWSTNSEISISKNNDRLWMVGTESRVYAMYYNETRYERKWGKNLDLSLRNSSAPIYNQVTLSSDEKYLYTSSASTSFYCMETETGNIIWKNPEKGNSVYLTQSKLSHDNIKLYSILHNDGTILQQNAYNGEIDWKYNCESVTSNPICQDSVKADFTLDGYSTTLYYGDIFGKIVALHVGFSNAGDSTITPTATLTLEPTTSSPTISTSPTSHEPTISPTDIPSNMPSYSPSIHPTFNPTMSPSISPSTIPSTTPTTFPSQLPTITPTSMPSSSPSDYPSDIPSQAPSIATPMSPFIAFMSTASSKDKFIISVLCIIIALCFTMCCLLLPMFCYKRKKRRGKEWIDIIDGENHKEVKRIT